MPVSCFARRRPAAARRTRRPEKARLVIDRLESRLALALDTLSIGSQTVGGFSDSTGDEVVVSITGSAGTAVFRDSNGNPVDNGDDIASIAITGASPDFQLTVGATFLLTTSEIGPKNGFETVSLGRVTADSVIRGINTVRPDGFIPKGGPSVARSDTIRYSLESFTGVDFSKGGGLFVDRVTGDPQNLGIKLSSGFSPYATIAIREQLDAVVVLGSGNAATADGRLLIESATGDSVIYVSGSGDTGSNSKLEILGGEGPFDATVGFFGRGSFAGTVNLQSAAGGSWFFEGGIAPSAELKAARWAGLSIDAVLPIRGVTVQGGFAGTLNATEGDVSLTVGSRGAVKGTARINSAANVKLDAPGVEAGAEINANQDATLAIGRNFAGRLSCESLADESTIGGNLAGATITAHSAISVAVSGSITNSTLNAMYGVSVGVGGNISNSTLTAGTSNVKLDVTGNIVNSRFIADFEISGNVGGSVSRSEFVSQRAAVSLAVGSTMTSSLVDAYRNVSADVKGTVSKSKFFAGANNAFGARPDVLLDVGVSLLDSEVVGRETGDFEGGPGLLVVNVARDALRVRFASREGERQQYGIGRTFQGSIQGGAGDVSLNVGGAVMKGSSLVTGGNAVVNVARNFDGVVDVNALKFRVAGNVAQDSRIVANAVRDWEPDRASRIPPQNFFVGGRLDGIVNVGVFDACPGEGTATILGGGAGKSARFNVGRFETDTIVFQGNFQGNMRVLQDLVAGLQFTGNVDRVTIGGQVLSDITVGGTLAYLNSNSWFQSTGSGKRTGNFLNGSFATTGTLTTGKYTTVVPVAPSVG